MEARGPHRVVASIDGDVPLPQARHPHLLLQRPLEETPGRAERAGDEIFGHPTAVGEQEEPDGLARRPHRIHHPGGRRRVIAVEGRYVYRRHLEPGRHVARVTSYCGVRVFRFRLLFDA